MDESLLRIKNLYVRKNEQNILQNINMDLRQGKIHGLLGVNGSGKSSLAYTLMGCSGYEPDKGRIEFEGQDITKSSITQRARLGITLAWQESARFEGLTTGAYLALGMEKADENHIREALEAVGLSPEWYLNRPVDHTLSGGERKRIELAAVFAMRPKLAILDEPDSGVDTLSLNDISNIIKRMAAQGTTILLITHHDEMMQVADSASLLCQGKIVFSGNPGDTRTYYGKRCQPHREIRGDQPWDEVADQRKI
ncbi:MAG: ABC transporter ATP-binding protein [Bacteroidales bacterium]|nr:ABC transporter ATP-binding protein [Bacteroidales bacterium]MBS3777203.1 ABC transporter ATP-binding protein [Bacteroidales bacterium]